MRIIIDGVFNHTGVEFWAFKDIVEKGENSQFADWYKIKSFDDPCTPQNEFDYRGWWNIKSLPEFNRTDDDLYPGPKQYIYHATSRWMDPDADGNPSDGIDGWRLDVVRDVPAGFWKDWSRLVKTLNHNAIIVGELWELSPDYITESGPFDALMNYNFAYSVKKLFIDKRNQIPVSVFIKMIEEVDETYPEENLFILQNLMTSHDTERLASLIKNPDRNYDRDANESNPEYNPSKPGAEDLETQKLIAAFQMTYRGAPMIYYGDEVGMWGADDPHCRKPMVWEELKYDDEVIDKSSGFQKGFGQYSVKPDGDLLNFYKKLIRIRNENIELTKGKIRFIYSDDFRKLFAFERFYFNKKTIVVFNLGEEQAQLSLPTGIEKFIYTNLLDNQTDVVENFESQASELTVMISPKSFAVYKINEIKDK